MPEDSLVMPTRNPYAYNICNSQEQMGIYQEFERKGWLEYSSLYGAKNSGVYGRMYALIDAAKDGGLPLTPLTP